MAGEGTYGNHGRGWLRGQKRGKMEDIQRLLEACNDPQTRYLQPIVKVALYTGMRLESAQK
jgi:hypothetical protein